MSSKASAVFIIAEAGANHNRNFEQALAMIDVASNSGADACKFQTYSAETLFCKDTPAFAKYNDIYGLLKSIEINRDWHQDLKAYCDEKNIEFMSTPFDEQAVQELVDLNVKRIKIAGFEATDPRFVTMVAQSKKPLIISAGIGSDNATIHQIIDICHKYGCGDVTILHCNNAYPTPQQDINLQTMVHIADKFKVNVGLSDHTLSPFTPALAVAMGAVMIEKHFTLSKLLPGPDHPFALTPSQLQQMVEHIRMAEISLGTRDGLSESEQDYAMARRSVVAMRDIKKGEILAENILTTKRPFIDGAIAAGDYYHIIGKNADEDIKANQPILWQQINR